MQQVVDLQNDQAFEDLDVALLSVAVDPPDAWQTETQGFGIETPLLSDVGNRVATRYGLMRWKMPSNEPGHTFVLVDEQGKVAWIRDYGAPENGGLMYVDPPELVDAMSRVLQGQG
jgi:peroxiredoxin